jgi:hypothetical protein
VTTIEPDEHEAAEWGLMQALGVDDPQQIHPAIEKLKQEAGRLRIRIEELETPIDDPVIYLLWSGRHEGWWRPDARGYTSDIDQAGRYTRAEALRHVVTSAQCGIREQVTSMVAAPDNWAVTP